MEKQKTELMHNKNLVENFYKNQIKEKDKN
jgi:hypothetical protein